MSLQSGGLIKGEPGATKTGGTTFQAFCSQNVVILKKKSSLSINVQNRHFRPKNIVIFKKKKKKKKKVITLIGYVIPAFVLKLKRKQALRLLRAKAITEYI